MRIPEQARRQTGRGRPSRFQLSRLPIYRHRCKFPGSKHWPKKRRYGGLGKEGCKKRRIAAKAKACSERIPHSRALARAAAATALPKRCLTPDRYRGQGRGREKRFQRLPTVREGKPCPGRGELRASPAWASTDPVLFHELLYRTGLLKLSESFADPGAEIAGIFAEGGGIRFRREPFLQNGHSWIPRRITQEDGAIRRHSGCAPRLHGLETENIVVEFQSLHLDPRLFRALDDAHGARRAFLHRDRFSIEIFQAVHRPVFGCENPQSVREVDRAKVHFFLAVFSDRHGCQDKVDLLIVEESYARRGRDVDDLRLAFVSKKLLGQQADDVGFKTFNLTGRGVLKAEFRDIVLPADDQGSAVFDSSDVR